MALPYGMILIKIFRHFEISFHDEVVLNPKPTNTINIHTLKRMKIVKENRQWVAKTKALMPSRDLLPYHLKVIRKWTKAMMKKMPPPSHSRDRPNSHMPSSSTLGFTFTEDHYNLLNGQIDSCQRFYVFNNFASVRIAQVIKWIVSPSIVPTRI
ncbi:Uncharacterized protein Adt_12158 [Abeliophyllum distichum]|uniref:Uncharacterized protein n=1 Tax=Abeliophyllum distichum TaxID=126358 RepID=A0ABD1UQ03_9LAMI